MPAGAGSGSLAERFSPPALRSRIPLRCARGCPQGLSVQALSTSSFTDCGNGVSGHQIAIEDLVSGDLPDQPSQDGAVDLGISQEKQFTQDDLRLSNQVSRPQIGHSESSPLD